MYPHPYHTTPHTHIRPHTQSSAAYVLYYRRRDDQSRPTRRSILDRSLSQSFAEEDRELKEKYQKEKEDQESKRSRNESEVCGCGGVGGGGVGVVVWGSGVGVGGWSAQPPLTA